jgi:hypothetical protein
MAMAKAQEEKERHAAARKKWKRSESITHGRGCTKQKTADDDSHTSRRASASVDRVLNGEQLHEQAIRMAFLNRLSAPEPFPE